MKIDINSDEKIDLISRNNSKDTNNTEQEI